MVGPPLLIVPSVEGELARRGDGFDRRLADPALHVDLGHGAMVVAEPQRDKLALLQVGELARLVCRPDLDPARHVEVQRRPELFQRDRHGRGAAGLHGDDVAAEALLETGRLVLDHAVDDAARRQHRQEADRGVAELLNAHHLENSLCKSRGGRDRPGRHRPRRKCSGSLGGRCGEGRDAGRLGRVGGQPDGAQRRRQGDPPTQEPRPQSLATPFEPILDGGEGDPQSPGHLLASQPFNLAEQEDLAEPRGHPRQLRVEDLRQFSEGRTVGRIGEGRPDPSLVPTGCPALDLPAARGHRPRLQSGSTRRLVQPSRDGVLPLQRPRLPCEDEEGGLKRIVRVVGAVQDATAGAQDHPRMAIHQDGEGRVIAPEESPQQLPVLRCVGVDTPKAMILRCPERETNHRLRSPRPRFAANSGV